MKFMNISEDLKNNICTDYTQGWSYRKLADKYNLGYKVIRKLIINSNVSIRTRSESLTLAQARKTIIPENINEIVEFYNQPNSLIQTTKKFNLSSTKYLAHVFQLSNVVLHDSQTLSQVQSAQMQQNWASKSEEDKQEIFDKVKQTCLDKYGVENYMQSKEAEESIAEQQKKAKQTCLEKYGVDNFAKTAEFKAAHAEKVKQTCLKKYGVENFCQTGEWCVNSVESTEKIPGFQQKQYLTKKKNNSFNISTPEEKYYKQLLAKFDITDIFRQYKDTRYPFACDFYIKSIDTFIELNLTWTHGGHKFNESSIEDQNKVQKWIEKNTKYYKNALNTWTQLDIKKFKAAEENALNYLAFYTYADALVWLENN